ncbi:PAS domain S-box protein [Rubrivivax gelatinosus]|uniref:histidine kinase n=1 Tax=Rubrivivax gelatinosus TaxID=28068 RepID=A0ABS1DPK6_RUBGE|nr:PAS domain S-box protein [Rubrivivax gelatinosus]MBK1711912.1 histidine kinase [Rubrivivax gelatinosus]
MAARPQRAPIGPRRLRHQLLALLILSTALAMALLYRVSATRLDDVAVDASMGWAGSVAHGAAAAATAALESGDDAELEATLRSFAGMAGVVRLEVVDSRGVQLLSLHQSTEGLVTREPPSAAPARAVAGAAARSGPVGDDAVQVWAPAGPGGRLGSFGVTFSLGLERARLGMLSNEAMLAIALVSLVTIIVSYGFVQRALAPLQRLVGFSAELGERAGARLELGGGSREFRELADALNGASARLRAQMEAIGHAESRNQAILQAVPDVILGLDAECRVQVVNPSLSSVFGLQPEEALGRPVAELLPELTREQAERRTLAGLYMRASGTHVVRLELEARRHGGTSFPAEVSLSRTETADGVRYAAVVRDMTEQRMTFAMLNLYSRALECTTNGVVICDMSLPGYPVFYANPAFSRITGYAADETIGRNCAFLQGEDRAQPQLAELDAAVHAGRSTQVVLRNYRKDGTLFFNELSVSPVADAGGRPRHYVGVLNDVTERERARMAIAERSARLNAVFDLSPDGFVVFDGEGEGGGRLVYCNPAFEAMTGWDLQAQAAPMTVDEFDRRFLKQCDAASPYPPLSQALAADAAAADGPDLLQLALPERRVLARMARHAGDGQHETILFFRDITRETEVDRMKSEFLTTAAHELRTPMVSVFGFTELLLRRPVSEERRRDMLETIHRQASLLINMVNELLDLARIEARQGKDLRREPCRLDSLVTQAVGPMLIAGGAHDLQIDIAHPDCVLQVDPEKTNQALTNVLSNAVKYSPAGGTVLVTTQSGELRGEPAVGVRVTDHGIGMAPEQLARIFERFYRADPSGNIPGTGLGMCLVKEIAELQGGRVDVASTPGRGTTVTIWLPLASAGAGLPDALSGGGAVQ